MLNEIIEGLSNILGPIATATKERSQMKDEALRAISHALNETYLYYRDIEHGHLPNRDKEAMLVKYWSAAAISLRHFDQGLANICDNKAEYWVNPDNYNSADIENLGIGLDSVRQAYRKMLKPDYKSFGRR
ncbi:hypothetical protein RT717_05940 [Imperialibacter roseus]|uniref:Uncharacterized protein n=1 Tax=Imperialibacter roseus TaxID=1324217 RepID=A0ABZ0IT26_9BACT|nr:hypothetical protein [Imperialibacter roseus]WOK08175.1 hypothetical protein RT717_05940 [Imperialibacter roseus]